jgi:hypothetical protein
LKQLQPDEVIATLSLWRNNGVRCLGMLNTLQQFVIGIADIIESAPERIVIRIPEILKRVELASEEPINEAAFAPADLISAWQSPMFGNPVHGAIGEHFDETLQLVVRGDVAGITLYRVTRFHANRSSGAAG